MHGQTDGEAHHTHLRYAIYTKTSVRHLMQRSLFYTILFQLTAHLLNYIDNNQIDISIVERYSSYLVEINWRLILDRQT